MDIPIFVWLFLFAGACFYGVHLINKREKDNMDKVMSNKRIDKISEINMGTYIAGFDNQIHNEPDSKCIISKDKFSFFFDLGKKNVDINLNSITNIIIEDKTLVTQRLTATRMLALGIFSLAIPKKKKHKEFCIVIEWEDDNAEVQNAVFEFQQELEARTSYNELKKYLPIKNKKCPFCAEIIKRAAVVCKHCGKDVPKG